MKGLFTALVFLSSFSTYGQTRQHADELPIIKKLSNTFSWTDALHMRGNARQSASQNIILDGFQYDAITTADSGGTFEDNAFVALNTNFPDNDQSLTYSMTWATQAFDTLFDINTFIGYPYDTTPVHLDSVDIVIAHENITGTPDTIIFTVYAFQGSLGVQTNAQEKIVNSVYYSDTVITSTSLSPAGQYSLYTIHPDIDIPGNKKFLVGVHFYGSTQNTFGLRAGYADHCGQSCVAYPSINQDKTIYRMVHWNQLVQDLTGVYTNYSFGLVYDCNQNGEFGERDACEYMFIQNFWMTAYVSVNLSLSASISGDASFCTGSSTILTAQANNSTGAVSYAWSTGATTQSISVSLSGLYSVTITDQNGAATAGINVSETTCQIGCTALPSLTPSSCTPQPLPGPGFSDTAICVVQGEAASTTINFQNFSSVSGITVEWIRIDSLTNLPCGLTFAMNDPDNTLVTSENACLTFSGTTNAAPGAYQLGIWVTIKVSIIPTPISGEAGALSAQFGGPPFGFFVIVNNPGVPCTGVAQVSVSGNVLTETSSGINTVTVSSTGTSAPTDMTDATGSYSLVFNPGESATVTPSKSNDVSTNNGITTLDILLMRRHILSVAQLNTPYKIIAADVNASSSVTTTDILFTRSLILQINTTFPNGKLWAFVPDDYLFANPQNPFPFTSSRTYNNLSSDLTGENFIGMKLGDVNNDWNPSIAKAGAAGEVQLMMYEQNVLQGQEIIVPVKVKDFKNITGYQFTLSWNSEVLELLEVNNKSLTGYYGMQKASEGFLTTSWDDEMTKGITLKNEETAFELKFRAVVESGNFSEIKISSELTASEAYNENLELLEVKSQNGMVKVGDGSTVVSHQTSDVSINIQPNPFTNTTNIIFTLPQDEMVSIAIYDLLGKEVKQVNGAFKAGMNKIEWAGDNHSGTALPNGLYHITMKTGNEFHARKVMMIR